MHKRSAGTIKNVTADKTVFDALLGALIASPPIRKDDLKPKRKKKRTKKA
jgi:hypothetical protein